MIVVAAAALCAAPSARADGSLPPWRVVDASGLATLSARSTCFKLVANAALPSGVTIVTRADGRATLRRGRESIVVSPQTDLTIAARAGGQTRVVERQGLAWFKVRTERTPHFFVETPNLTATVRGTTFTVAVDAAGAAVHVREGAVEIATRWRDAVTLVRAGTMASVARAAPDRIALINGGNVMRVVTGRDAAVAGLRRGGDGAGTLFAPGPGLRKTVGVRPADAAQPASATAKSPGSAVPGAFGTASRTPPAQKASREGAIGLPLLETTLGALVLLALIVAHTFFGSAGRAKAERVKASRDSLRDFDFGS